MVFASLGRGALRIGEPARVLHYWEAYGDGALSPVDVPTFHYHLGEAHLALGNPTAARLAFAAALAPGLDTHSARLARACLDRLAP